MRYLFLLDANYQATDDNDKNMEFEANETYELNESIGNIFVKRGAAVAVEDDDDDDYLLDLDDDEKYDGDDDDGS